MPKVVYTAKQGLYQELGEGLEIGGKITIDLDTSTDSVEALDVTRGVTLRTSPTAGISETSGSLLMLYGRAEGLFFHLGGNQYISNNAWYDGSDGSWKYQTADSAAFRWGFRGGAGCFDLDWAVRSTSAGQITSGSTFDYSNMPGWGTGLSVSASLGAVTIGKKADRSKTNYNPTDGSTPHTVWNGANAMLDITGSVNPGVGGRSLSLAVTGSVEFGCGDSGAFFMLPKHDSTSRDALPAEAGMMIYNTQTNEVNFHNGSAWQKFSFTAA